GAVVLGIVVLTLTIVGDVLQKTNRKSVLTLALLCLLCVLAVNINPYGISYWSVLKPVGGEMFSMIDEWKSPLTAPTLPFEAFALLGMVVFVAALAWIGNPQRRWSHLLWLLFFCVMFLSARRNLWPLALTAIVVASANAGTLRAQHLFASAQISKQTINLFRAVAAGLLVMWTVSSLMPGTIATKESKVQVAAVSPFAPVGVAQYVIGHRPPQPVFNDYLRSGYYHWSFAGNPELYIDLHNAYPPSLLKEYFEIIGRTSAGIQAFENRNFQTVILGRWDQTSRVAPLANYLDASGEWDRKYSAVDGTVWVKK
ncbi:MAG TPA: hypothetical protein VEF04_13940, partial [Blastocatellia bacterium]|nr:hypothetical protein [Blastocatellia bacterium]